MEQLARSAHGDDDDRYLAQLIVRESDRLSRLLSEFLDFARVRATEFVPVDLQAVVTAAARMVREHPDRFIGAGTVNIMQKPMQVVREVDYLVKDLGLRCLRLEPYMYGDGMTGLPPNDKHYWPVYMRCSELGVAVAIQVGHTGPLLPSECGRPIYLDEVALSFPDLAILGCHVGQPWHEEMMVLAWKHPNVYLETSARGPRQWPRSLVDFAKGWGQDKVIWATDYPLLGFDRTLGELEALGVDATIYRKIVRDNLLRALRLDL